MNEQIKAIKQELERTREDYWNVAPEAGELLQALIFTHRPKHILEIGTSNGYGAIILAEIAAQYGGHITTIEYFEERFILAQENIQRAGLADTVTVLQGDAIEVLTKLQSEGTTYDFFFIDASKKQYADFVTQCMALASPHAIIVADNTVSHRDQLDSFFSLIHNDSRIEVLELAIGAGLTLLRRSDINKT